MQRAKLFSCAFSSSKFAYAKKAISLCKFCSALVCLLAHFAFVATCNERHFLALLAVICGSLLPARKSGLEDCAPIETSSIRLVAICKLASIGRRQKSATTKNVCHCNSRNKLATLARDLPELSRALRCESLLLRFYKVRSTNFKACDLQFAVWRSRVELQKQLAKRVRRKRFIRKRDSTADENFCPQTKRIKVYSCNKLLRPKHSRKQCSFVSPFKLLCLMNAAEEASKGLKELAFVLANSCRLSSACFWLLQVATQTSKQTTKPAKQYI